MHIHNRLKMLDGAYLKYGFKVYEIKNPGIRVYTLQRRYFYNAEIVPLIANADVESIQEELQSSGFLTRIQKYKRDAEAHQNLFNVFFQILPSRNRLLRQAKKFKDNQSKYLGFDYDYVPAPFEVDSNSLHKIGEKKIIETITSIFQENGPHIIFLEAAAGFGKTCTAIEILSWILKNKTDIIPIFTELSRNRGARIFRYVLLDEIDRNFNLPSTAVTEEIHQGRIPLIIDGFDELLSKKSKDADFENDFIDAEPMLDTIASLLQRQAKILVTTRRTAVFTSQNFEEWIERLETRGCFVHRIILKTPRLDDWLGKKKKNKLQNSGVPIEQLSNPVLLSFLAKQNDDDFNNICSNPDEVVNFYFNTMLIREKNRQDLRMESDDQIRILKNIASVMLKQDLTMDTPDAIRGIMYSNPQNLAIINKTCELYFGSDKVSVDEIIDKLLVHALLDRVPIKNLIGFINDFVLGTLQGELVSEETDWVGSDGQIDRIATAFSAQSECKRKRLWDKLELVRVAGDPPLRLSLDLRLLGYPIESYSNAIFEDIIFKNVVFSNICHFSNCTFIKCNFISCKFELDNFSNDIGFCECNFQNCSQIEIPKANFWERGCKYISTTSFDELRKQHNDFDESKDTENFDFEKVILERYWPPGRPHATQRKRTSTLYKGTSPKNHRFVTNAIDQLAKRDILKIQRDNSYVLNLTDNYDKIIRILNRK